MVAPGTLSSAVATTVPRSVLSDRGGFVRFTADDVQGMLKQGYLPEDATTELLNGLIILKDRSDLGGEPLVHGPKHRGCIRRLTLLVSKVETTERHAQVQLPIVCGINQLPEPDFAIIRGSDGDFVDHLPTALDTLMVLEAADSSLERDQEEKLPIYAAAGIPQYIVLNLRTRAAQVYSDPDPQTSSYGPPQIVTEDQMLQLRVGAVGYLAVPLKDLLP